MALLSKILKAIASGYNHLFSLLDAEIQSVVCSSSRYLIWVSVRTLWLLARKWPLGCRKGHVSTPVCYCTHPQPQGITTLVHKMLTVWYLKVHKGLGRQLQYRVIRATIKLQGFTAGWGWSRAQGQYQCGCDMDRNIWNIGFDCMVKRKKQGSQRGGVGTVRRRSRQR